VSTTLWTILRRLVLAFWTVYFTMVADASKA